MKIEKDKVVTFHYILKDDQGEIMESSQDGDPMAYLHGHGNIVSGLEKEMEGKEENAKFSATVFPKDGYGERNEEALQRIPIKHIMGDKAFRSKLKAGMIVSVNTDDGVRQTVVLKVGKFNVDVDTNHPLAGKTLTFEVAIQSIRDASSEEISHGHAHGVGGHQH